MRLVFVSLLAPDGEVGDGGGSGRGRSVMAITAADAVQELVNMKTMKTSLVE
jgi:hypothetical protein